MRSTNITASFLVSLSAVAALTACSKDQSAESAADTNQSTVEIKNNDTSEQPPATSQAKVSASDDSSGKTAKADEDHKTLELDGVTMSYPASWELVPVPPGPMKPVAVFRLKKAEGGESDAEVRITHFPRMKGMDDMNLNRWVGMVKTPDGEPMTREQADIETIEQERVRLKILDEIGMVNPSSGMGGGHWHENHRIIAAIVDHPDGPHFVKAFGDATTMEKWGPSIDKFLRSAEVK